VSLSNAVSRIAEIEAREAALQAAVARLSAAPATSAAATSASPAAPKASFAQVLAAVAPDVTPLQVGSSVSAGTSIGAAVSSTPSAAAATPAAPAAPAATPVATAAVAPASDVAATPGTAPAGGYAYPLAVHGDVIGLPYEGSHTLYGNWESDNAVDVATPVGTPVYAVADGTIGREIGSLDSNDPHLAGLRLHLVTDANEFYYAHLSQIVVQAGDLVHKGQLLGYSGEANGVAHLHFAAKSSSPVDVLES
jgi:murein DD-endopeptidase MepM/ murein hydrolase activator NlpD